MKMSGNKGVKFADEEDIRRFEYEFFEQDDKFGLPLRFLFALYEYGYEVVEVRSEDNSDAVNPFFVTVAHQMGRLGVYISWSELRNEVIKYQKENVDVLQKVSGLLTPKWHRLGDMMEETVEGHISQLEKNETMVEIFDFYCTAKFLGVALHVFSPDYDTELLLNRFNDKGGDHNNKRSIAIVVDSSRRPVRLFSTLVVHKHRVLDNPYYVLLKKRRVRK